jgi:hypothetical protein
VRQCIASAIGVRTPRSIRHRLEPADGRSHTGQRWKPLAESKPRFRNARPIPRASRYPGDLPLRWVDSHGRPLADEWTYRDSPVQRLLAEVRGQLVSLDREAMLEDQDVYDVPPEQQLELALQALEVPGTPEDYGEALRYARQAAQSQEPPDFSLLEELLRAHIALVLADPEAATGERRPLDQASEPFAALLNLYTREGFLLEAAEVQ